MRHSILAASLTTLLTLSAPAIAGGDWYADFDEAVAAAKESNKNLLVDFTGSDWCGWCIKLHEEVFDHDAWIEGASKDYIFVALDFPSGDEAKAAVPNPERNEELKNKYGVRGFPTIFLMTPDGVAFAQTGYQAGGPEKYLEHMGEIATAGKKAMVDVQRVLNAFEAAEGDEAKWQAWDAVATVFEGLDEGSPFTSMLVDQVRWGIEADPENKNGKKLVAVRALLKAGMGDDEIVEAAAALDPKNEQGLMDRVAQFHFSTVRDDDSARAALKSLDNVNALGFQDKEIAFMLNFQAANWCSGPLADPDKQAEYAEIASEIGTDDERMKKALEALLG